MQCSVCTARLQVSHSSHGHGRFGSKFAPGASMASVGDDACDRHDDGCSLTLSVGNKRKLSLAISVVGSHP